MHDTNIVRNSEINLRNGFTQPDSTSEMVSGKSSGRKYQEIDTTSNSSTPAKIASLIDNPQSQPLISKTLEMSDSEMELVSGRISPSLPEISIRIELLIEERPNILLIGKNEGLDLNEVDEIEDDELNENFNDLDDLDIEEIEEKFTNETEGFAIETEGFAIETEGFAIETEGLDIETEEVVITEKAEQKVIAETNQDSQNVEVKMNKLLLMGELTARHANPEMKETVEKMTGGFSRQFALVLEKKGMSITDEKKPDLVAQAQFYILLNKIAHREDSAKLSEEEVKKNAGKITDFLRPEIKTEDGFSLSDIDFDLLKDEVQAAVYHYFILIGLIIDQAIKASAKEKTEDNDAQISLSLKQDSTVKEFYPLEFRAKLLVGDISSKILKMDLEIFLRKLFVEKMSEKRREQNDIEKSDRIHHEIKQVEIKRQDLNIEKINKSIKHLDTQKNISKEVVVRIDQVTLPILFQHVLIGQKPAAAA